MLMDNFCVFILTHGRPENVITFKTLKRQGYTGKLYLIIDNEDKKADRYFEKFGKDKVIMFDKKKIAESIDEFDNFEDRRSIVYARNACFEIAREIGIKYFLQLDDDYEEFKFRINHKFEHPKNFFTVKTKLNEVFMALLKYYLSIPALTIATSQGGDWFGGERNFGNLPKRKAMNTFFCSIDRPFKFIGRINEDVNTYTQIQSLGNLFMTIPLIQMDQKQTQKSTGGMTEIYLDNGTYIKSFYTIICSPSCVKINTMGRVNKRLHHIISWNNAVPCIIDEKYKKK